MNNLIGLIENIKQDIRQLVSDLELLEREIKSEHPEMLAKMSFSFERYVEETELE